MKVLLIKDVYNLGRAGEVKKVADGYARNFLLPQKLAVRATTGAVRQVEKIQAAAAKQREILNAEMSELAEKIQGMELEFTAKVGETGRLYGSVTQEMIADAIGEKIGEEIDRHRVETQPLREVGEHTVKVRLTYDLIPEVKITVISEEEAEEMEEMEEAEAAMEEETAEEPAEAPAEAASEEEAEAEA